MMRKGSLFLVVAMMIGMLGVTGCRGGSAADPDQDPSGDADESPAEAPEQPAASPGPGAMPGPGTQTPDSPMGALPGPIGSLIDRAARAYERWERREARRERRAEARRHKRQGR